MEVCVNCNRLQDLISLYFSTKYQSAGNEAEMLSYIQTKLLADSPNFTTAQIQTALDTCKNSWKKNVGLHAELGGYVNMNQSPQVHFRTDNFSLEAWVFPEAINNTIQHIIANHTIRPISGVENMGGYRLYMLSGKLYLQMDDYSGALASGGCAQIRTINTISASEWHHIIAVRNGNNAANFKIYVDGVLQQTEVADYSYLNNGNVYNESNSGRLVYGNRSGSGVGESFIGFIKNVKIYKKVMTATEALANYTSCSGAPADTTNLVLWTRLENGSGTVVSDSSRFATNGIMTASAGWGGGVGIAANANCIGEKEGVLCNTRTVTVPVVKGYRYGFNGKENDNEVKGEGSQQDYGMRIYDPRVGRFLSEDPITKKYPELTPYQFASNNPIDGIDLDGLEKLIYVYNFSADKITKTKIELPKAGPLGNGVLVKSNYKGVSKFYYGNEIPNANITSFKKTYEGVKLDKEGNHIGYNDSKGNPTIGYGHLIKKGEDYIVGSTITEKAAQTLFESDAKSIKDQANKKLASYSLSTDQLNALYDAAFNMGPGKLSQYTEDGSKYSGENFFLKFMGDGDGIRKRRFAQNILYSDGKYVSFDVIKGKKTIASAEKVVTDSMPKTEDNKEEKK